MAISDVIRVMRENPRPLFQALHEDPEPLNDARRLVLTKDPLALSGKMAEVIERRDRTNAELERKIVRILPSHLNRIYGLYRARVILGRGVRSERSNAFLDEVEDAKLAYAISDGQR